MKVSGIIIILSLVHAPLATQTKWVREKHESYSLFYTGSDKKNIPEYNQLLKVGIESVNQFCGSKFQNEFEVFVHPNRQSLDSAWQKDWGQPDFKSQCWMVASGVGKKLDMISPIRWNEQACEHKYEDKIKTQQLITHELFHVFHGQRNVSPDFSNTENIDWFVEGLANYASGQFDTERTNEVKKALHENKVPARLDDFWTGKIRYGLSGSVIKFIDAKFGRAKLLELLQYNKKSEILATLKISEENLLAEWRKYINEI